MTYIDKAKEKKLNTDYRAMLKQEARHLADLLAKSPEYCQFIQARSDLEADDEQSSLFTELRQQQMTLSMAAVSGEDMDEATANLNEMYMSLINNPVISDYLYAEGRLFHLLGELEEIFSEKLEIWQPQSNEEDRDICSLLN